MLSTLTGLKQNVMKMIQDVKLCMKNSANIAIVSKKLLKTKNRGTLKTKSQSYGDIKKELENSKSSDFPIRVIKKLSHTLTPVLTVALKLIESYLPDRKKLVYILGEISDELLVLFGVPQGSCLGLLLFLIYINGLPNISNNVEFVLFADDTNIFVEAKNRMLAYKNANKILKAVHLYMLVNKLHYINKSKCCFIDFKPDKNVIPDSNLCLKINNVVIKSTRQDFLESPLMKILTGNPTSINSRKSYRVVQAS